MKNTKSMFIAALAVVAGAITSCTDKMDNWDADPSFDRLFSVQSLDVTPAATSATVEYKANGASNFQIQYSTSEITDDMDANAEGTTTVESTSKTSTEITDLISETDYYLRIRAIAAGKTPSKWVYYTTSSGNKYFTTKGEQIMNDVASSDITENSVRVSWEAGATVTHLKVHQVGDEENVNDRQIDLDDAAKTAGEYTITGLAPSTAYVITIWNGLSKRGERGVATGAAMPSSDYSKVLDASETLIDGEMLKALADQAAADGKSDNYGVTIGIPANTTVDLHTIGSDGNSNLKIPNGMSITFFGMAGGDAPTIKFQKNIDLEGQHAYITFENVNIVNDGADYFVNQSKECNVGTFTVKDATVSGFATAFFRLQKTEVMIISKLVLENSIFHDMCSGYSFIHVDAGSGKGVVNNIEINNSTLYNIAATNGKMFIYSKNTNMESISVKNTTFYNCIGNNNYWVDFGDTSHGCSGTFEFVKCLFTKTPDDVTKNNRSSNEIVFSECYKTADFFKTFKDCNELEYTADDLFTDPASGNFLLKKDIQCGDPRWYKAE